METENLANNRQATTLGELLEILLEPHWTDIRKEPEQEDDQRLENTCQGSERSGKGVDVSEDALCSLVEQK